MGFLTKIFSAIVIIIILYFIGVFLLPDFTDNIAKQIGILDMNKNIRSLKTGADNVSEDLLQIKSSSEIIDKARNVVDTISGGISTTKNVVNEKIDQTNKVVDTAKKTKESIDELQKNISELTTFTGSSGEKKLSSSSELTGSISSGGAK